jgi:hypothetical protein
MKLGSTVSALAIVAMSMTPAFAHAAGVHVNFVQNEILVHPGETFTVFLTVHETGDQFNGFDANIYFDPAFLTYVPTAPLVAQVGSLIRQSCASNPFHYFRANPSYLEISVAIACASTYVTGPGTIYQVKFHAPPDTGTTTIFCGDGTQFYRAGFFVNPLDQRELNVRVSNMPVGVGEPSGRWPLRMEAPVPNPRAGAGTERFRFTLPEAGAVTLDVFDSQGRRIATRGPVTLSAGPNQIALDLPRLRAGSYFARLTTARGVVGRKWAVLE